MVKNLSAVLETWVQSLDWEDPRKKGMATNSSIPAWRVPQTEEEDIKKWWQEYTEELYKKDLHDSDNHDGVITHLEPDILECEVKQALGCITTNKVNGGDGIPGELFQILRDDAVKVVYTCTSKFGKLSSVATGQQNVIFNSNPKERQCQRMLKLQHNCTHITYQKIMLKIP